jgi:hypothetical protein
MLLIPGWLVATLTFPGVIVHEVAHRFFCDVARVPVFDVCYFRVDKQAGYVAHAEPGRLGATFLIAIGPLIINTVLCAVISFVPIIALNLDSERPPPIFILLAWLGISIGMHAFPSGQDMRNFSDAVCLARGRGLLYFVAKGFEALIGVLNALRIVWSQFIYAGAVAWIVPGLLALFAQHAATH